MLRTVSLAGLSLLLLSACGDDAAPLELALPFEARVGALPLACGETYEGLGTTPGTYAPKDLRFYVHDLRLVTEAGEEVALTLPDESPWQHSGVALLDFADRSGACETATAATRATVSVRAPGGHYRGLRFRVGVPEELNHQDASTAAAPLSDIGLHWSWRAGYLFARIEGNTPGLPTGHVMHLGSTDCLPPAADKTTGTAGCARENRPEIDLADFSPEGGKVVFDLAALLSGSDLNANTEGTAAGCMSGQNDPECAPLFARWGLGFGDTAASTQSTFRAE